MIPMNHHRLSVEQRFQLEAAFREIDACQELAELKEVTKQILTAHENEKAFVREATTHLRKELETRAASRVGLQTKAMQDFSDARE